ncbi:MBL fold metallo-hydrolase [Sphaerochaeta globosa]|uniref:Beta-lactamase domain protein n=1 Tax=Sphaerochaeta globosa (strain ATCC BAA-1886 / DSM 22777 / Buddy) TaxID=158189 RepID=F0RWE7_SPHGB|nr:MBL fold metallo-hydrolase [Sphaerochaeta globosa]ADY13578.1 beta-lactamase domain protein [Sphaerochaeta globosa str. Buddy]
MLQYAVLGSGSSGNSYVFSDGCTSILIDQGYSVVELRRRLDRFGIDLDTVKAVAVTHLHPDHAKGVGTLCRKQGVQTLISTRSIGEQKQLFEKLCIPENQVTPVAPFEMITIGPFCLFCFATSHDSAGSVGWFVTYEDQSLMVLTDTGLTTEEHKMLAKDAKILFLEANYDKQMLQNGPYPLYLKRRIDGSYGHLSNEQALSFLQESGFAGEHIYFIHLSDVNNDPALLEKAAHRCIQTPFTVCHKNQWYGPQREAL